MRFRYTVLRSIDDIFLTFYLQLQMTNAHHALANSNVRW